MKEKLLETFEKPIRLKKYILIVNRRFAYHLIKNNIINEFKKYLIEDDNYWIVGFNPYDGKFIAI